MIDIVGTFDIIFSVAKSCSSRILANWMPGKTHYWNVWALGLSALGVIGLLMGVLLNLVVGIHNGRTDCFSNWVSCRLSLRNVLKLVICVLVVVRYTIGVHVAVLLWTLADQSILITLHLTIHVHEVNVWLIQLGHLLVWHLAVYIHDTLVGVLGAKTRSSIVGQLLIVTAYLGTLMDEVQVVVLLLRIALVSWHVLGSEWTTLVVLVWKVGSIHTILHP